MINSIQDKINSLMPSIFDTGGEAYKLLLSDEDTQGGAIATELAKLAAFRDYYTKTTDVDDATVLLLDKIISLFSGLTRNFAEPDDYFRLRYKALVERRGYGSWTVPEALRKSYSYFFADDDIFIIESHPTTNLLRNGSFEALENWVSTGNAEAKIVYSKSFDMGSALQVIPNTANDKGIVYQDVVADGGWYSFVFFLSSTKKGAGVLDLSIQNRTNGKYWNPSTETWGPMATPRYTVDNATPGKYKLVQLFLPVEAGTIRISFSTASPAGFLLDAVAFGPVEYPNLRAMLVSDPTVFHDNAVLHDNTISHNGFHQYYILDGLDEIMNKTRAAGVKGETYLLSSRLNIPWDRVTIHISPMVIDVTPIKHDAKIKHNSIINYGSSDTWARHLTRNFRENICFAVVHDGKIQYNGNYDHSGIHYGVAIGLSRIKVSKYSMIATEMQAYYNNIKLHNAELLHDGKYTVSSRQLFQYYI